MKVVENNHGTEEKTTTPTTPKGPPKGVTFGQFDDVYEIPHLKNMSQEEIDDCWMSEEDFRVIRVECRDAIKALDNGLKQDLPEGYYLRGLDQQTMVRTSYYMHSAISG